MTEDIDTKAHRTAPLFSLRTRQELVDWAYELLPDPYACPQHVGATYRQDVRELEWVSRPLWAVFALIAGGESPDDPRLAPFIERMRAGLTPGHELAFPDPTQDNRQVAFEQVVYGYGLLCLGDRLLALLAPEQQERLAAWLNMASDVELPWGNWYLARIVAECGLKQTGLLKDEVRLAADCAAVESMHDGDGWYEDGTPFKRDLYIAGTFHFYALLFERYMDQNPIADTVARANAFDEDYAYWFDAQGRAIPFGRSLTYRFGNAAFWSALVLAGCAERPIAEVKGLMLNHLSWWHDQLAGQEDPLAVGYGYPNAPVAEDYAGPGISYWALKAFTVLALPEDDPFWQVDPVLPQLEGRRLERRPGMLIQTGARHTYALSSMQYASANLLQRASKYGKFCYSTAFGWNVTRDVSGIVNFALDSALAIGIAGTRQYASRTRVLDHAETQDYVYSVWDYGSVARVETWLVPVDELRHARVHRIESLYPLDTHEGGFPVLGWNAKFDVQELGQGSARIRRAPKGSAQGLDDSAGMESVITDVFVAREEMEQALRAAGLVELLAEVSGQWVSREAEVVRQNPMSNIYSCEANAVPALRASLSAGTNCLACLVYGDPGEA